MIEINNLNFSYGNKKLFENINLTINNGSFIFISGPEANGKTTLIKLLAGLIKNESINTDIEQKEMGIVFESPENYFITEKVSDEITFMLENLNCPKKEQIILLKEVSELLEIEELLDLNPHSLSGGEKELVALASALVHKPKLLLIDGTFSMLDEIGKDKVMKVLRKINTKDKTTIICTTNNLEDTLYGKRLILIDKKVILDEKISDAFNDEAVFKKCHLDMPFMASLSHKLKYYGLTDKVILNMNTMVNTLWK